MTALDQLTHRFSQLSRLDHAMTYLGWDQMVMMPPAGNRRRSDTMAELAALHHQSLTAPEVGEWLDEAEQSAGTDEARLREMRRTYREATALPADLVRRQVLVGSTCEQGWRTQRPDNDWAGFLVNFRPVVDTAREVAEAHRAALPGKYATPYDALMAQHCLGDKPETVCAVFDQLSDALPPLLEKVLAHQAAQPVPSIPGPFQRDQQIDIGRRLAEMLGFDFDSGRLDTSLHPFSTGGRGDLRITTRYDDNDLFDALQATAHEIGHASYEGGLPEVWADEPVGNSRSMSVHESQSLYFEKHLFLSQAFQSAFASVVHAAMPTMASFDAHALWRSQIGVGPSHIRVEADEVTYPLHVLLRYEIERDLMNGDMEAEDVPDAWNESMQRLLGIDTRGDYTNGCLQDIHWTDGAFGYFPSYTLGAVNAAQIAASIDTTMPEWRSQLTAGNTEVIAQLRAWLGTHIWERASTVEADTLMRDATGSSADPSYLLAHLERRYLDEAV